MCHAYSPNAQLKELQDTQQLYRADDDAGRTEMLSVWLMYGIISAKSTMFRREKTGLKKFRTMRRKYFLKEPNLR